MGSPLERRRGQGRRRSDDRDTLAVRGLLHDVGHEMTTLSYLVEAVRGDVSLPDDSTYRLELLSMEMSRLLAIIRQGMQGLDPAESPEPVELRAMLTQLARLAELAYEAEVTLTPGPPVTAEVNPVLLWRVVSNLVDNAARAAGPGGRVELSAGHRGSTAVVEVADDGPGFGSGPPGMASMGLDVVKALLEAGGGSLEVQSPPEGGTIVRVVLPGEVAAPVAAGARRPEG